MESKKSSVKELFDAIVYVFDSIRKKISLETYLSIISEYADRLILMEKKNGNAYLGGKCHIKKLDEQNLNFYVEMYFRNQTGKQYQKEASRVLPSKKFIRETMKQLNEEKVFEIIEPSERK
jgi:hypothetical protein